MRPCATPSNLWLRRLADRLPAYGARGSDVRPALPRRPACDFTPESRRDTGRQPICRPDGRQRLDDLASGRDPETRRGLLEAPRGTRLQLTISAIFALLILPALASVIAFSYRENARI